MSPVGCGALCQLHESCEAFLIRDTGVERGQSCTILKELSHTNRVTDDYEERAYVAEDKGKEFIIILFVFLHFLWS